MNQARRENPALQSDWSLRFHPVDNEQLIAYSKMTEDRSNIIVGIVNLDFRYKQVGLGASSVAGIRPRSAAALSRCTTCSPTRATSGTDRRNYVELNPAHNSCARAEGALR